MKSKEDIALSKMLQYLFSITSVLDCNQKRIVSSYYYLETEVFQNLLYAFRPPPPFCANSLAFWKEIIHLHTKINSKSWQYS